MGIGSWYLEVFLLVCFTIVGCYSVYAGLRQLFNITSVGKAAGADGRIGRGFEDPIADEVHDRTTSAIVRTQEQQAYRWLKTGLAVLALCLAYLAFRNDLFF